MLRNQKLLAVSLYLLLCSTVTFSAEVSPKALAQPTKLALLDVAKTQAVLNLADNQALVFKAPQPTSSSELVSNASGLVLVLFGLIGFIMRAIRARV